MIRLLTIALLFSTTIANAQQVELNLKITPIEADLIWKGLRELPVKDVEVFMQKMRQQIVDQTQPKKIEEPKKE